MKNTLKIALFSAALATASTSVFAAPALSDLGTSKQETIKVTLTVPKLVNITKPDDISMNFDGSNNVSASKNFCIATNMGLDVPIKFRISDQATSSLAPISKFTLKNSDRQDHNTVPFRMTYPCYAATSDRSCSNDARKAVI